MLVVPSYFHHQFSVFFILQKGDHIIINSTLQSQLQQLLYRAYNIQDHYEQKLLTQVNANVAMDSAVSALTEMDRAYEDSRRSNTASLHDDMSSDQDSFVSATDVRNIELMSQFALVCEIVAKIKCYLQKE